MSEIIVKKKRKYTHTDKGRLGMTKLNNKGKQMTIVSYTIADNITIEFKGEKNLVKTSYNNFKNGTVQSYIDSLVFGHGIIGKEHARDKDGNLYHSYICWHNMIQRCFSEKAKIVRPTYRDATCCDEWLYFANFKNWYDKNFYSIENERIDLDKDIIHKGNKIYSPENCVFAPQNINVMFIRKEEHRGLLPIGVRKNVQKENTRMYNAVCSDAGRGNVKSKHLGSFITAELAFGCYKNYKENLIKEVADEYKDKIPVKLYQAMYNYIVEITD